MSVEKDRRVSRIAQTFLNEYGTWKRIYDEIEEGYLFLAGEQYTEKQKRWYESQRRPTNVFNLLLPIFNQALGDLYQNQQRIRIFAKRGGDPEIAALLEDIILHENQQTEFEFELGKTILAGLVKHGYIFPRYSNELQVDGSIVVKNVDEFEIMFDSRAREDFLDDAAYLIRSRFLLVEDIFRLWPQHRSKLKTIIDDIEQSRYMENATLDLAAMMQHPDFVDKKEGKYRVIEFHEIMYEKVLVAYDTLTREEVVVENLSEKRRELFLRANPQMKLIEKEAKIKKITEVIPGLNFYLQERMADLQDGTYDYIRFVAYPYTKQAIDHFGIFKNAKGPQKEFNDLHNRTLDIVNKTANPGQIRKQGAFVNEKDASRFIHQPGVDLVVKKDVDDITKVWRRVDPPQTIPNTDRLSVEAVEFLYRVTGITPNLQGLAESSNEPASLYAQKVQRALTSFIPVVKNIDRMRNRVLNKEIRLIQMYYTSERMFLVADPETFERKEIYINLRIGDHILNDITVGEYQVTPEQIDNNPTSRHVRFLQKTEIVDKIFQLFGPQAVLIIDPEWWLGELDLTGIRRVIENWYQLVQQQIQQGQQAEAFQVTKAMLDLAKQKAGLASVPTNGSEPVVNRLNQNVEV
ncbi:MAG: hypothetical protein GXO75_08275 [Calditrichaeota bacterium]|nr:hypothetical protein [Calditrichota bacterium]